MNDSLKNTAVTLSDSEKKVLKRFVDTRNRAIVRYPLLFGLLVTFGFVCTLYGFEKLIDRVDLFADNPWILLGTGLLTLLISGAAYEKLH